MQNVILRSELVIVGYPKSPVLEHVLTLNIAQREVVERMKRSGKTFTGNLAFFNSWELFWSSGRIFAVLVSAIVLTKMWLTNARQIIRI